jgi:uncharacterized membrane protein/Mg-chelatase subunit ChlD
MSLSFIYPQYLWLLILVPLTISLSLVRRRALSRTRFWSGITLRSLLLILIVFALAGIQLRLRTDTLTTVFILDVSDSVSKEEQTVGEEFIRQAVRSMPVGDRAAIVVFGEDALVERLASEERILPDLASIPVTTRTDIASALQLAQAIFPAEGAKRIVLLSDGRENIGQAVEQASLAASQDMELLFVPLGSSTNQAEVLIDSLAAPSDIREGESLELVAVINSTAQINATLRIFEDGSLIQTLELRLQPGDNRVSVTLDANQLKSGATDQGGFRRFLAQIIPEVDNRLQNNEASAFTVIHGPPYILVVEGQPGEANNLVSALESAEMRVTRLSPSEIPTTLTGLAAYQAVLLINVNASALPQGAMQSLPVYVRDLGMGLLMTGGQDSFGAGGYLRTPIEAALPVEMDVKDRELQANLALVVAVDKSGSMGRCHCDNPDLNQTYTRQEVGQPKVDIAKEAIMRAASVLGKQDFLGVVTFDSTARWALRIGPLVDMLSLEQSIGTFQAEGSTNLEAGVMAAYEALQNVDARRKHIILMTDGWVRAGDLAPLAIQMKEKGITLSVVAAGGGSAQYLASLAELGGGRYYAATNVFNVPDIFLKETVKSVGQYIIEEPFYPLPASPGPELRGLDTTQLPALLGYNGATARNTARQDLLTPRGDPLLATWQYGLGRSAAWTSDLKGQWAVEWLRWSGFSRFASQLVSWLLPAPKAEGLEASAGIEGDQAVIHLQAVGKDGQALNFLDAQATIINPNLHSSDLKMTQVGPGQYQAAMKADNPGTYLVRLGVNQGDQSLGQLTLGMVVPYSPEYKASGVNRGLLNELARLTGGSELTEPLGAFLHNLPSTDYAREIWRSLLLLAALLFPLDIALRRVMLGKEDWEQARIWLTERLPWVSKPGVPQSRLLGQLFQARQRARERIAPRPSGDTGMYSNKPVQSQAINESPPLEKPEGPDEDKPKTPVSQEDALARLKEAKKRARK